MSCVSEDMKCLGAWDIMHCHKAHHTTDCLEERNRKPTMAFLERTKKGRRQSHGNADFKINAGERDRGCSAYGIFRAHNYHLEMN